MAKNVAIIGAGLAGLCAATELAESGADVTVFEARDRVGGRLWTAPLLINGEEVLIERGGEFFLHGYSSAQSQLDKYGLKLADTGMSYYVREPIDAPGITAQTIMDAGKLAVAARDAAADESLSAEDIITRIDATPEVIEALRGRIEISTAVLANEVWSQALTAAASFEPLPSYRVVGGNDSLPKAMAATLGSRVRLNTPVTEVRNLDDGRVAVTTEAGTDIFDAAVVTVPFAVMNRMTETGALPTTDERERAGESLVQGHAAKLHLPLAAHPAETSAIMSISQRYWTWTATTADGSIPPVLNGFMGSYPAIERSGMFESPDAWAAAVQASRPDLDIADDAQAVATLWPSDPWSLGSYTAHAPGTHELSPSTFEQPIGKIYWAGEYCDDEFTGLIEGAVRSGLRAAHRVLNES
jgi:monoamine oxidase